MVKQGLVSPATTQRGSNAVIAGASFGTAVASSDASDSKTACTDMVLEDVNEEEVSGEIQVGVQGGIQSGGIQAGVQAQASTLSDDDDASVETFEYDQTKGEKPQRGEWFHSYGANKAVMDTLKATLGVQETHLSLVSDHHEERPQMEFVKGDVPQNDYLVVLSHELKLNTPSDRQQQEDESKKKTPAGAAKGPLPLRRRSSSMTNELDHNERHSFYQRNRFGHSLSWFLDRGWPKHCQNSLRLICGKCAGMHLLAFAKALAKFHLRSHQTPSRRPPRTKWSCSRTKCSFSRSTRWSFASSCVYLT
jgi:hypothetical protein